MTYPYETLIILSSPLARIPVSMEYSGLFTLAQMGGGASEEGTMYHEMAHQWFYCLIGNNENAEPWLDEAFAEFAHTLYWESLVDTESSALRWRYFMEVAYIHEAGNPINVPYDEADNYTNLFYSKGAYFLKELMDAIGKDEFLSILYEYCETYAFGFATTEGFLNLIRERVSVDVENIISEYIANVC